MNQLVAVSQIAPQTLSEAVKFSEWIASSKLIPKDIQGSPADVFIIMEQARRWEIDFFALVQEVSFVRGRPMYSGKLTAAVVNARGGLTKRLSYDYDGAGDSRTITVSGQIQGEQAPRVVKVRLGDAKTGNEQWAKQPDQMLMYHGARVWARRHTPELMLGIYGPDEFDETPAQPRRQRDAVTGEVIHETAGIRHDSDGVVLDEGIPGFLDRRSPASLTAGESAPSQVPPATHPESGADNDPSHEEATGEESIIFKYEEMMEKAAKKGSKAYAAYCKNIPKKYHKQLADMDTRCKELAQMADREITEGNGK
jgi:hypothetical protein